jgi:hypothetical protein
VSEFREFAPNDTLHEDGVQSRRDKTSRDSKRSAGSPGWIGRHVWPLTAALAVLVTGLAFSFWWNPLANHKSNWDISSDLWITYRAAQYVGWGFEGEIYKTQFFDSFPGIAVLLAPIAKLGGILKLSESFPFPLSRPSAWFILGPVNALCGGVLLFPLDRLAQRLLVSYRRRVVLVWLEAALIFIIVVLWGHPEYTLALTFAISALIATFDGKWVRVGIFMGLAILFQPLTALMVPVVVLYLPARRWFPTAAIVALPSLILLIPPLVKEWQTTTYTLLHQPNFPTINHPTPWLSLAPVIEESRIGFVRIAQIVTKPNGTRGIEMVKVPYHYGEVVAAGPGRLVALLLACAIGVYVAKAKPTVAKIVWWVAVCLSLRCAFECVIDPYYLLPAAAVILVLGATCNNVRFIAIAVVVAACAVVSDQFMSPWAYYTSVNGLVVVALVVAWPRARSLPTPGPNVDAQTIVQGGH